MSFLYSISQTAHSLNVTLGWLSKYDIVKYYCNGPFLVRKKISADYADPNVRFSNHATLEFYSLYDIKTYQKFGLNILENEYIVNHACENGNLEFLDWWLGSGLELKYNSWAILLASVNGHCRVLDGG